MIALTFGVTSLAFALTENWPWKRMPDWTVSALNVIPPATAGAFTGILLAWLGWRLKWYAPTLRGHLSRLALPYALCLAIISEIVANQGNSDFGLWSQIIEWPLAAMLSLAAVDVAVTLAARRHSLAAT